MTPTCPAPTRPDVFFIAKPNERRSIVGHCITRKTSPKSRRHLLAQMRCTGLRWRKLCRNKAKNRQMKMIQLWSLPLNQTQRQNRGLHKKCSLLQMSSAASQAKEAVPVEAPSNQVSSLQTMVSAQFADNSVDAAPMQDHYPAEYNPFDRPVEEVAMQLFDDDQPVNSPPTKRQRSCNH